MGEGVTLGLPHSHWWNQLCPGDKIKHGDQIFIAGEWKPFYSLGIQSHVDKDYAFRRRIARPMYAFKMREIIDNSPILHKRVIT